MSNTAAPTTYAPTLPNQPAVYPTGNTWVAFPDIRADGAVRELNVTSDRLSGLLAARGTAGAPLLRPCLAVDGKAVDLPEPAVERLWDWVPRFTWTVGGGTLAFTLVAPPGEQGFLLRLKASGIPGAIRLGLHVDFGELALQRFRNSSLGASVSRFFCAWTKSNVYEASAGLPVMALALRPGVPTERGEGEDETSGTDWAETGELDIAVGVAADADGARATAVHMARLGFDASLEATGRWIDARCPRGDPLFRRHALFNYFFSYGDYVDALGGALMTSRSPRYYVAGAFWSRDALLWSFPAVLAIDPQAARARLLLAFGRYTHAAGEHAQYLNGRSLYPGFELDEAAVYPWALARYLRLTGDSGLLGESEISSGLERVLARLARAKGTCGLYATMLGPTDDPVAYPYLVYDNALLAAGLSDLAKAAPRFAHLAAEASAVTRAVCRLGVVDHADGPVFAWAVDGEGRFQLHDEPAGSLLLLAPLGFCSADDPVWRRTRDWITGPANPHHHPGAGGGFAGEGSPHFPFPSCFSLANRLAIGRRDEARRILTDASLDTGLGCEAYDPETGDVRTGAGFAAVSGFLAWCMEEAGPLRPPSPSAPASPAGG